MAFIVFGFIRTPYLYFILRLQGLFPWYYPAYQVTPPSPDLSFNMAVSFFTATSTWQADTSANGAPVPQLSTQGAAPMKSLVAREVTMAEASVHGRVLWFTAPGFKDRAMQMLYYQLPYNPESLRSTRVRGAWVLLIPAALGYGHADSRGAKRRLSRDCSRFSGKSTVIHVPFPG